MDDIESNDTMRKRSTSNPISMTNSSQFPTPMKPIPSKTKSRTRMTRIENDVPVVSIKNMRHRQKNADQDEVKRTKRLAEYQKHSQFLVMIFSLCAVFFLLLAVVVIFLWSHFNSGNAQNNNTIASSLLKLFRHLLGMNNKNNIQYAYSNHVWYPLGNKYEDTIKYPNDNLKRIVSFYPESYATREMLDIYKYSKGNDHNAWFIKKIFSWFLFWLPDGNGYIMPTKSNLSSKKRHYENWRLLFQRMIQLQRYIRIIANSNNDEEQEILQLEYHDIKSLRNFISQHAESCFGVNQHEQQKQNFFYNSNEDVHFMAEFGVWCMIHTGYARGFIDINHIILPDSQILKNKITEDNGRESNLNIIKLPLFQKTKYNWAIQSRLHDKFFTSNNEIININNQDLHPWIYIWLRDMNLSIENNSTSTSRAILDLILIQKANGKMNVDNDIYKNIGTNKICDEFRDIIDNTREKLPLGDGDIWHWLVPFCNDDVAITSNENGNDFNNCITKKIDSRERYILPSNIKLCSSTTDSQDNNIFSSSCCDFFEKQ